MSSRSLPKFSMPEGFPSLLKDFAREVLRSQPVDVNAFAVEYFSKKINSRDGNSPQPSTTTETKAQEQQMKEAKQETSAVVVPRSGAVSFTGGRHVDCEDAFNVSEPEQQFRTLIVCDGHGGTAAAQFVSKELLKMIISAKQPQQQQQSMENNSILAECFMKTDGNLMKVLEIQEASLPSGSTGSGCCCVCAVIENNKVSVANVGDSRCIIARKNGNNAIALSHDHKVSDSAEKKRIEAAGGFIHGDRLLGVLAVSRSFGDFEIKKAALDNSGKSVLICEPDVITHEIDPNDEVCLILASDGLWDALSNDEAQEIALRSLAESGNVPKRACEALIKAAVDAGSEDDITVIIALLP